MKTEAQKAASKRWAVKNPDKIRLAWQKYSRTEKRKISWRRANIRRLSIEQIQAGIDRMEQSLELYQEELWRRV